MEQIIIFLSVLTLTYPFNLDTKSPYIVKTDSPGFFGYSVALHQNDAGNFLMVGAPTASTAQPGVVEGGAVYKCRVPDVVGDPVEPVTCSEQLSILDDTGNKYVSKYDLEGAYEGSYSYNKSDYFDLQMEQKSHQWLGVTLQSGFDSDYLVGCAHRYETRYLGIASYRNDPPRQLTGKCKLLDKDFEDLHMVYEPCKGVESGLTKVGNCQAGASAFWLDNKFMVGAPGCYEGSGCLYLYETDDLLMTSKTNQEFTDPDYVDSLPYTGYSSTMCDLNDDGIQDLISGGPRGKLYRGQVLIYQSGQQLELVQSNQMPFELVGEQMGSYYGASVLCQDMNGDGIDDLVIGAPWYSLYLGQGQSQPDTGRVYFYPGSTTFDAMEFLPFDYDLSSIQKITGTEESEAFGFALSTAGDVNNDGLYDLLIGSPYFNEGEGKVSLFLGGYGGIQTTPSQVITPTKLGILDNLRGFGWSMAGGKDMDNNGISDALIGSFKSQHAVLLRSVPIIDVDATIAIFGDDASTELDPLGEPTLDVPGGKKVQGINLQACFEYTGASGYDQTGEEAAATVNFQIKLDSSEIFSHSRLYTNYTTPTQVYEGRIDVELTGNVKTCTAAIPAYYRGAIGHSMNPIEFTMGAGLEERDSFANRAVLNQQLIFDAKFVLNIASDCPSDTSICLTEIAVNIGQVQYDNQDKIPLVIGLVDEIKVPIQVLNKGPHSAYGSKLQIDSIPGVLPFLPSNDCNSTYTSELGDDDPYSIVCALPALLKADESVALSLEFNLTRMIGPRQFNMSVLVVVLEPSVMAKADSGLATFSIDVKNLAQLQIRGGSSQGRLPYNNKYGVANKALGYEGPTVKHVFEVSLSELSINRYVNNITVSVYWPQRFPDGAWLFPLSNAEAEMSSIGNITSGPAVTCDYQDLFVTNWDLLAEAFDGPDRTYDKISCKENRTLCDKITCRVEYLERGGSRLKLNFYTRVEEYFLYGFDELTVESYAELISVEETMILPKVFSTSAQTTLFPSTSKSRNMIWIIIAAVVGALLILAIIFFLLWKIKFFKRGVKLPEPEPPTTVGYKANAFDDEYYDEADDVLLPNTKKY